MQNTISEHTTRQTLKQMGSSSRRLHRLQLLSAKNKKRRLQFTHAHQNWTKEDCKNVAWSDESRFLLQNSDGRVRMWHKEDESMDPSCLVSTIQAAGGGVMVWGIFSWHTLGHLVASKLSRKQKGVQPGTSKVYVLPNKVASECIPTFFQISKMYLHMHTIHFSVGKKHLLLFFITQNIF